MGFHDDRIIVTCGAREMPEALMAQLKVGGIMVIPLGDDETQAMLRFTKTGENSGEWKKEEFGQFSFVPMLNGRQMH